MNPAMIENPRSGRLVLVSLAAVMLGTRMGHFHGLPDASWAVFFAGGLYLRSWTAFVLLMAEAVGIDYLTTQHMGVSAYCISPAYPFLLPAYASLWLGGRLCPEAGGSTPRELVLGASALLLAVTFCFLASNGSFYWLSGRVASPSLNGWWSNAMTWYAPFLTPTVLYVSAAVLLARCLSMLLRRGERATTA